jgi:CDP-diacylglycerol--glycerol-3-phosphate 3-phosphatidyltransferase/cardiolipin synthase
MLHLAPNGLTLARLAFGVAFPFVAPGWQPWLIVIAAATDLIDGWLARHLGVDGRHGKYLDPVADKVFALGVLISVLRDELLSPLEMALLLSRDGIVVFGTLALVLAGRKDVLARTRPTLLGKVTTAVQFIYFFLITWVRGPVYPVLAIVVAVSALAGLDYLRRGWRTAMRQPPIESSAKSQTGCSWDDRRSSHGQRPIR